MEGKTVIVTSADTGKGYQISKKPACRGARVVLACRDIARGLSAQERIVAATGNPDICLWQLHLESFRSVKNFAYEIMCNEVHVGVLINNAGVIDTGNTMTADRLVREAQVNHFSPFLLTLMLIELMRQSAPSRIINVTSSLLQYANNYSMKFNKSPRNLVSRMQMFPKAYANVLFTGKLSGKLEGTGVTVNCVHPGATYTKPFDDKLLCVRVLIKLFFKSARDGAQAAVHVATLPAMETVSGRHFVDCKKARLTARGLDVLMAVRLWRMSEHIGVLRLRDDVF